MEASKNITRKPLALMIGVIIMKKHSDSIIKNNGSGIQAAATVIFIRFRPINLPKSKIRTLPSHSS
jgi:hypothetical protein